MSVEPKNKRTEGRVRRSMRHVRALLADLDDDLREQLLTRARAQLEDERGHGWFPRYWIEERALELLDDEDHA